MDEDQSQGIAEGPASGTGALENPFPGLRPFEADETHLFFGREGQSDEILRILGQHRFVAVVGTSGSGKSSLVRAGMIPSLEAGYMAGGGSSWRFAVMRPGEQADPIASLAHRLADPVVFGESEIGTEELARIIDTTLRRSSYGLIEAAKQQRLEPGENLLVLVDQFEELFRLRTSRARNAAEDVEAAFVRLLLEATRQTELPIYVVITMRSDFIGDCSEFRDLPEALNRAQFLIPRMTRDQRREAIEGPIAVSGASISPRLVQRMLNDVGDNPDQLPILQHALMRTWAAWYGAGKLDQPLDLDHYQSIGGWENALSLHADEAFNELDARGKETAERVFKALVERTADSRETRRPGQISTLAAIADATVDAVIKVIDHFRLPGRTFLMPPAAIALNPDSVVDISHESLIRLWKRLHTWVAEEAESATVYKRLADAASRHKREQGDLWRELDLKSGLDWQKANRPNAAWAERYAAHFADAIKFLELSRADQERDRAEREAARRKLLASEESLRIRNWILRGVAAVLLVSLMLSARSCSSAHKQRLDAETAKQFAIDQERNAEIQKANAEARELRTRAYQARNDSPEVSALLAVESARTLLSNNQYALSTDGILREALRIVKPDVAYPPQTSGLHNAVCHSKPITFSNRGRIARARFNQANDRMDFTPDGDGFVAVCQADRDPSRDSSHEPMPLAGVIDRRHHNQPVALENSSDDTAVAFTPDGAAVVAAGDDGRVRLFNATTGHQTWEHPVGAPVAALEVSHTGKWVAVGFGEAPKADASGGDWQETSSGGLAVLNIEDGSVRPAPEFHGWVVDADFSRDGQMVAAADWNGEGALFNADTGKELIARISRSFTLEGHTRRYNATTVAFSDSGRYVAYGFGAPDLRRGAGLVVVYDLATMKEVGRDISVWGEVAAIRFSPSREHEVPALALLSKQRVWVGEFDEVAQIWTTRGGTSIQNPFTTTMYSDVAFSPDGQYLVVADTGGLVYFYDPILVEQITYRRFINLGQLIGLKFSQNSELLATIGTERTEVFDLRRDLLASRAVTLEGASPNAKGPSAFDQNFTTAVVPAEDGSEYVYKLSGEEQFKAHRLLPESTDANAINVPLAALALESRGRLIAFADAHQVQVQDAENGKQLWTAQGNCGSLAFGSDGRWLAAATVSPSGDSKVQLLNSTNGTPGWLSPLISQAQVRALAFSSMDRWIAIGTNRGLFVADTVNGGFSKIGELGTVIAAAFSGDEKKLAIADAKGTTVLFKIAPKVADFSTFRTYAPAAAETRVEQLEFSPDGRYLMEHTATSMIHLFDVNSPSEISNFDNFTSAFAATFDPASKNEPKLFLAISNPDSVSVFRAANRRTYVNPARIIDQVCGTLTRNLDCKEWRTYFTDAPYRPICPNLPAPKCS